MQNIADLIIEKGYIEERVNISGIWQRVTFKVIKKKYGSFEYITLHTDKLVSASDLVRIADETGLPVESPVGRAFPKGKMAEDFKA
ncbi:MAG: hypothetical protein ACP5TJ_01105 [Candidatus Micrarchaeia archaeon]